MEFMLNTHKFVNARQIARYKIIIHNHRAVRVQHKFFVSIGSGVIYEPFNQIINLVMNRHIAAAFFILGQFGGYINPAVFQIYIIPVVFK